ncbi:HupE/UreJ family protein [Saprospiraceae bacterium]
MTDFQLWFTTGLEHILDPGGLDHVAFIIALTIMFPLRDWKQLLLQITAFTLGHSLTLALSVLQIVNIKQSIIEILIPLTIIFTAAHNLYSIKYNKPFRKSNYIFALFFGLIHGLGFSYLLRSMLSKEDSIVSPLFAFNLGLEAGQIIVVGILSILSLILSYYWRIPEKKIQTFGSLLVLVFSLYLLTNRF